MSAAPPSTRDGTAVRASVVIPAFDAERTLPEQLAALRAQEADVEWEVLVCDNGSRDGTREIVAGLAREWPRLRLVDASARRGPSAARNIGARVARGEVLLFCDADDVVGAGWVALMSDALADHALVAGRHEGELLNAASPMRLSRTVQDHELFIKPFPPGLPAAGAGNLGVRRDVFLELDGFCEAARVGEDVDLCWRAQLSGHDLVFLRDAVVHVRKPETLRAAWRRSYATGAGDRWLAHRFVGVPAPVPPAEYVPPAERQPPVETQPPASATTAGGPVEPAVAGAVDPGRAGGGPTGRASAVWVARARRLLSARRPGDVADWACTVGFWLGSRVGRFTPPEPWEPVADDRVTEGLVTEELVTDVLVVEDLVGDA